MDEANRAERILGDAIGRHIIEAINAGFQPPPGAECPRIYSTDLGGLFCKI